MDKKAIVAHKNPTLGPGFRAWLCTVIARGLSCLGGLLDILIFQLVPWPTGACLA